MAINFLSEFIYTKNQRKLFFVFILMSILNFGNYSFLIYNFDGSVSSNLFLVLIQNGRILIPSFFIIFFLSKKSWKYKIIKLIRTNKYLFILSSLFLINTLISSSPLTSITYTIWLISSLIVIILVVNEVYYIEDLWRLLKYGTIITVILSITSIPSLIVNGSEGSFFSSKNYYAYPLLIYISCELMLFLSTQKINYKKIRIFVLFLIFIVLFLSGRRTPTIFAILFLSCFLYYTNKLILISFVVLVPIFGVAFSSISLFGFSLGDSRTFERLAQLDSGDGFEVSSYVEREFIWNRYLNGFYDSPLVGNGYNTSEATLSRYYSGQLDGIGYHNTFLQILVEGGLFGLCLFLLYIFQCFMGLLRINSYFFMYFVFFITVMTVNWVETNFFPGQIFFIFSITLMTLFKKCLTNG
jgi:O-antigen ligase